MGRVQIAGLGNAILMPTVLIATLLLQRGGGLHGVARPSQR
ncbi:hypothetical protein SR870_09225 [Rhodopseudomonas palustris]|nr:hypothetical protein [Rhodopseudomonas palustris]WQH01427.1 hypothetical protein SR870_09225 [Rhodopseudomonas palustris]